MDKDLHNVDDIFNSAYQQFEDEPSDEVWNKINAELDKRDAEKYKKRFISWRRVAVILILVLSGFALYETGIIKLRSGGRNYNDTINKKSFKGESSLQNEEVSSVSNLPIINKNSDISDNKETQKDKNYSREDINQQQTNNIEETIKETAVIKNDFAATDQDLSNKNSVRKNKPLRNQPLPKSNDKNSIDKTGLKKTDLADRNNNLKILNPGTDITLIDNNPDHEIIANKKQRAPRFVKTLIDNNLLLNKLINKTLLTHNPDRVLSSSLVKQQTKKRKENFKPYWTVTGFASNDWAKYKLDNDMWDNTGSQQDQKVIIAKRERHESSLAAGIMATLQLKKNLGFKTGLVYSNTSIVIDPQKMYAVKEPDAGISYKFITSSGYGYVKPGFGLPPAIGDSLNSRTSQHILQSLRVPLAITYKFGKKNFTIAPSAGIAANFITQAKVETEVEDPLNREAVTLNGLKGLKKIYLGFIADVNMQYKLDKRWAVNILPNFRYAISPITKKNVVKTFPYSFGLGMGVTYKL